MTIEAVLLDLALGFVIGLSLGLLGGGGSILTVPALVYLVGQSPQAAVTTSLAIVGANSAFGALFHLRGGTLNWRVAALFGGAGMVVAYLSAGLSKNLPPSLLMVLFAMLMLLIGTMMLVNKRSAVGPASAADKLPLTAGMHPPAGSEPPRLWKVLTSGALVGLLTGILGVGGGFLIVPALVMLLGLPVAQAIGTSLAIISANSVAGLLGHLGGTVDLWVTVLFAAAGINGTFVGARMAKRLPAQRLRQAFAVMVILLALILILDNAPKLLV